MRQNLTNDQILILWHMAFGWELRIVAGVFMLYKPHESRQILRADALFLRDCGFIVREGDGPFLLTPEGQDRIGHRYAPGQKAPTKSLPDHPLQPTITDEQGTRRFRANPIVQFLLDAGPFDMNMLARMPFQDADREQFAQLIGYSLSGFSELHYVSGEALEAVDNGDNGGEPD